MAEKSPDARMICGARAVSLNPDKAQMKYLKGGFKGNSKGDLVGE